MNVVNLDEVRKAKNPAVKWPPEINQMPNGEFYNGGGMYLGPIPTPDGNWLVIRGDDGGLYKVWGGQPFWK